MLSRGIIIGKVVDDLAALKYQIDTRNRLGQFDLSKFCEDFCKELLNIVYDLNLKNLNATRSNNPGLDLGDDKNKVAYQITSTKTSTKINETLSAITPAQKTDYNDIRIFILGNKQGTYTIDTTLAASFSFDSGKAIHDIDSLLRDIVVLESDKLHIIYTLFSK